MDLQQKVGQYFYSRFRNVEVLVFLIIARPFMCRKFSDACSAINMFKPYSPSRVSLIRLCFISFSIKK